MLYNYKYMHRPSPSTIKFSLLSGAVLLGTSASLASLWAYATNAARQQAAQLVQEGNTANGAEAQVDYQLATWLDPRNQPAYAGLARLQIATGQTDEALDSLAKAGEGSEVEQLKVRTLMELGRTNQAADEASKLTTPGHSDDDLILASLAYALAGRTIDDALIGRLSSPEAVQRVQKVKVSQLHLANELFATGLLKSSSALLVKMPDSFQRNLQLARIGFARHEPETLIQAENLLNRAILQNPTNLVARHLLSNVYRAQNKSIEAQAQEAFIAKVQSGRL